MILLGFLLQNISSVLPYLRAKNVNVYLMHIDRVGMKRQYRRFSCRFSGA